jgi:uncharacterized membrane protein YphA (DoxX/SURF4 family)
MGAKVTGATAAPGAPDALMRWPDRWLVVVRVVVGVWFLKSLLTKLGVSLVGGFLPAPVASGRWVATMPKLLTRYMAENPFPWYKHFVLGTVLPNAPTYATLTALGEVAVGIGLTFGFLTGYSAVVGAFLVVLYGLAVQHMGPTQQGFHVLLFACMIAFIGARAGRTWGADGWLRSRYPTSYGRVPLT